MKFLSKMCVLLERCFDAIYIFRVVCCELRFYIKRVENSFAVQRIRRKERRKPSFSFIKLKFRIKTEWKLSLFCSQNFWLGEDLFREKVLEISNWYYIFGIWSFSKEDFYSYIRKIIFSLIYHDSCGKVKLPKISFLYWFKCM